MRAAVALLLAALAAGAAAQEYSFDASSFARRRVEFSGEADLKLEGLRLNADGSFHKLALYNQNPASRADRATLLVKPAMRLNLGETGSAFFRAHLESQRGSLGDGHSSRFDEAYYAYKPAPGLSLEAGKRSLKWGKGYAWNPVGFVERSKDPNDPELAREGYTALVADVIRHFDGPLQTVAFTPVLVPVSSGLNPDFGASGHANPAAKLYMLWADTDIDLVVLGKGSRPARYGFDFSRNLGTNLEIHGEWARVLDLVRPVTDSRGAAVQERLDADSYVLGARYLSSRETTYIVEYYRNGAGYSPAQLRSFHELVDAGAEQFRASGGDALLKRAANLAQGAYGRPNAGRRYLYLRASQKEPFDILYFTPAVTLMVNLEDRSFSLAPELSYAGISNVLLQLRAYFLGGGAETDFGEKQNDRRVELLMRAYF